MCLLLLCLVAEAQQKLINISELLKGGEESVFFFAAGSGDEVAIRLHRYKGSKISEFSLYKYPKQLILKEKNIKKLKKDIIIGEKGIYQIKVKNKTKKLSRYALDTQLFSKSEKPLQIGFKAQKDTTYAYQTNQLTTLKFDKTNTLQKEKFYLNSRSNALIKGGKNRIIFPVNLPKNTVEWFYVFTASRKEADIKNTLKTFNLAGSLTTFINQDKSLQNSVNSLNAPPGADICDIYVLDEKNARLFIGNEDYTYDIEASRENFKSGIIEVAKKSKSKLFLGIKNPDNIYGIHVSFEIVAIVEEKKFTTKKVNIPVITSYPIPYIK